MDSRASRTSCLSISTNSPSIYLLCCPSISVRFRCTFCLWFLCDRFVQHKNGEFPLARKLLLLVDCVECCRLSATVVCTRGDTPRLICMRRHRRCCVRFYYLFVSFVFWIEFAIIIIMKKEGWTMASQQCEPEHRVAEFVLVQIIRQNEPRHRPTKQIHKCVWRRILPSIVLF